jgi:hypothetical protein
MSAEQYFDGQDTIPDIEKCLPYGWRARPLQDDIEGVEFYFPVPNDVIGMTYDNARVHVEDAEDAHDTIYAAGLEDSEEVAHKGQQYFSVETVFPLSDGLFQLLDEARRLLAIKAQLALTPEDEVMDAALEFIQATEHIKGTTPPDAYFDAPDTFDDLSLTLPKGWLAEQIEDGKIRFVFLVPQNFKPVEMAPIARYVHEMQVQYGSRYEAAYDANRRDNDTAQAAFMIETSWPIRNKAFTMLQTAGDMLIEGSLDSIKVSDRKLLDPKSWLEADEPEQQV